jgi:uncharacterized protein YegJ (DUF2314 family)
MAQPESRTAVAMALAVLSACHRSSATATRDLAQRAPDPETVVSSGATTLDPDGSLPLSPTGSLMVGGRPIDLALYLASPVPGDTVKRAQDQVRKALPGVSVRGKAEPADPPSAFVAAPPLDSFAPPTEDDLRYFGRGLDALQTKTAAASKGVLVMGYELDADPNFVRLRAVESIALDLAIATRGFVWDELTRELFAPDAWKSGRTDGWQGDVPDMRHHVTIHYYETDGNRHRAITLGMVKFGLPDLVASDVPVGQSGAMTTVIDALAQLLVEGAAVGAGNEVVVDLRAIRHEEVRRAFSQSAKNAVMRGRVALRPTNGERGDPDNRLVELRFPSYPGASESERQAAAVLAIVGGEGEKMSAAPKDDAELDAVKMRVQQRLPAVAAAFRNGLPLGEHVSVKAPFRTDTGSIEWMWFEVGAWDGQVLSGTLANEPEYVSSLKLGGHVQVRQPEVADYIWRDAIGNRREGGESSDILLKRQRAGQGGARN